MTILRARAHPEDEILARLTTRPVTPTDGDRLAPGLSPLGFGGDRDGLVFVPSVAQRGAAVPLVVCFHDGGRSASDLLPFLQPHAERAGVALLAPDSRHRTWDRLIDGWGADVTFVDVAIDLVARRLHVDRARLAMAGFSDGANYALSLALANGDLITHAIGFSPGHAILARSVGRPRCFVTHGTEDPVVPLAGASRRLVPQLERLGCDVTYHEFDGGHEVPPPLAAEALAWLADGARP
jgi:phospholipase/carboxylesterase